MIQIKNRTILSVLLSKEYHPLLIELLLDVPYDFTITEGWREGSGVHSAEPCRGIDLRSWEYTSHELKKIESYINSDWVYDPERPEMKCCIIHDVGKGDHIHLQVHPNTIRA